MADVFTAADLAHLLAQPKPQPPAHDSAACRRFDCPLCDCPTCGWGRNNPNGLYTNGKPCLDTFHTPPAARK